MAKNQRYGGSRYVQDLYGTEHPVSEPVHGYCTVCEGPIERGMQWTITAQMNRVHNDPDRCIEILHPKIVRAFLKANPHHEWPGYE